LIKAVEMSVYAKRIRGGMMKKLTWTAIFAIVFMFFSASSHAQFLGQLETAPTLMRGDYSFGGYAGVYDDAFAIFGGFRSGVTNYLDFGIRLGLLDYDRSYWGNDESGIVVGTDLKYRVLETGIGDPLDLSLGGGMEFSSVEHFDRLALGGNAIISKDFCFESGRALSPYGRLNVRMERKSWRTHAWHEENHDTDLEIGLCLGVSLELSSNTSLVGELQLDEFDGMIVGANFYID
jgi:hypothetical protein